MPKFESPDGFAQIDYDNLVTHSWQSSTIDAQPDTNDRVCIILSPSQFRSLLSSAPDAVSLARHILQWTLRQNHLSRIIIVIADEIQKYNVAVFEHKNEQVSLKTAISLGQKIFSFFSEARNELPLHDSQKIHVICWKDMLSASDYDHRVEDIRRYVSSNQSQCIPLIDTVCKEYARARSSRKHLKQKDLVSLREYVMHELPALLNGIDYEGNAYRFMLHPTLKSNIYDGNDQREAMVSLLNHMREHYLANTMHPNTMCHIFDVEFPRSLITVNDHLSIDPSESSSTSDSELSSSRAQTSEKSFQNVRENFGYLWLILFFQLTIVSVHHFWLPIFCAGGIFFSLYSLHMLLIQKWSKRGEWPSIAGGQQLLGTQYQSFFGDLPAIQACQNGYFLNDLQIRLGRPQAYRIWMGPEPALMLAHPQAVKDFWNQHKEKEVERNVHLGWPLEMLMSQGVGFRSMDDRNRITKFFHICFGPSQVRRFDSHLEETIISSCSQFTSNSLKYQDIKYLAHDAGVHLFLGPAGFDYLIELHALVDELRELMIEAFDARWTNLRVIGYYLLPKSYQLRKRIRLFNKRIRDVLTKIINIYRQAPAMNNEDAEQNISLLAHFARDPSPLITFDELTDTIVEGLLAPNDGTAGTFMYTLLLLAMHPHVQDRIREDLKNIEDLTLKSLDNIKYLDQILSECQRLFPIFMFNVPEFSSQEMTISGIRIPKNTMVMLDVVSLNRNDDAWGPDPMNFRPERFAPPVSPAALKAYHGFGNGHLRRCLGQYMIKNLHRLFLAHLLTQKQVRLNTNIISINDIERFRLPFIYIPSQPVQLVQL